MINYFKRVKESPPLGLVTFERRSLSKDETPDWSRSVKPLTEPIICSKGTIEDAFGAMMVDFADPLIGGIVLTSGNAQEEIMFMMHPELIVARLFTEELHDNESLIMVGAERFNCYSGYGRRFEWTGNYVDIQDMDPWRRKLRKIVAIDALYFPKVRSGHCFMQYEPPFVVRELMKAYCGFRPSLNMEGGEFRAPVATGKWGCGVFHGDVQLKFLIQLMALSESNRHMIFYAHDDQDLNEKLMEFTKLIQPMTVGQLYTIILKFHETFDRKAVREEHDLFDFIKSTLESNRCN